MAWSLAGNGTAAAKLHLHRRRVAMILLREASGLWFGYGFPKRHRLFECTVISGTYNYRTRTVCVHEKHRRTNLFLHKQSTKDTTSIYKQTTHDRSTNPPTVQSIKQHQATNRPTNPDKNEPDPTHQPAKQRSHQSTKERNNEGQNKERHKENKNARK